MSIFERIKSVFRREAPEAPSTLRNKAGGYAWINGRAASTPGAEMLIGHPVKTVAQSSPGMWQIDPPQEFIATAPINISGGRTVPAGTSLKVIGIGDDTLDPWQEDAGGVTDKEVRELYTPQVKELRNA
jgi:hypothetical protein